MRIAVWKRFPIETTEVFPYKPLVIAAFITTILFSLSAVTALRTTRVLSGTEANFWRLCIAALLLAGYSYGFSYGVNTCAFPMLFISGCIGFGIGDLALFQALPRLGSRLSIMLVHCLAAPFAALVEWMWMGIELSSFEMIGAFIILLGVACALIPEKTPKIQKSDLIPGLLFGCLAAIGQGLGAVQSRRAYQIAAEAGESMDGISAAYQRLLGGLLISGLWLLFLWARDRSKGKPWTTESHGFKAVKKVWPWILANGIAGPALGVSCYQWALKSTPTGIVLPIIAITPLVVIPFTMLMKEEQPGWRSLVGGVIAVGGAVFLAVMS